MNHDWVKHASDMNKIAKGETIVIKKRKVRAKETRPRQQPEREFRREVIKYLRSKGCLVKRIENGICNELGNDVPDLFVFNPRTKWGGWVELKSLAGVLGLGQKLFKDLCFKCNVNHIVAYCLEDLNPILWRAE